MFTLFFNASGSSSAEANGIMSDLIYASSVGVPVTFTRVDGGAGDALPRLEHAASGARWSGDALARYSAALRAKLSLHAGAAANAPPGAVNEASSSCGTAAEPSPRDAGGASLGFSSIDGGAGAGAAPRAPPHASKLDGLVESRNQALLTWFPQRKPPLA
jgi:hypothetical protein